MTDVTSTISTEAQASTVLYSTNSTKLSDGSSVSVSKVSASTLRLILPFIEKNMRTLADFGAGGLTREPSKVMSFIMSELDPFIEIISVHIHMSTQECADLPLEDLYTICVKMWEINSGFFTQMSQMLEVAASKG